MKKAVSLLIALLMIISVAFSAPATAYALETDNAINATESNVNNEEESLFMRIIRTIFFSKLTFDSNGGSEVPYQYAFKFFGRFSTPAEPTKEGYTFDGWEPSIPSRAPFGNVTVKAKWNKNNYQVNWIVDEGVYLISAVPFGDTISKPDNPKKEGYTFVSWYPIIAESMPAEDLTYTAIWKKDTNIIVTDNDSDFTEEVTKLTTETFNDTGFNAKEASNDPYYTSRVVARIEDISDINFEDFEADTIIINNDGLVVFQFSTESLAESCVSKLNSNAGVSWATPDVIMYETTGVELNNIPSSDMWANNYLHTSEYANYIVQNNLNREIKVAVVDSGVDMKHADFQNRIEPIGVDLVDWDTDPSDVYGHGTEVAGIITACTPNLNVKIVSIRTMNQNGVALGNATGLTTMSLGIKKAVELGVDVINFSCGASIHLPLLEEAVQEAINAGIVVVVSAGNGDVKNDNIAIDTANWCPAHINGAIVVGAIDKNEKGCYFSNYGQSVDFVAPGLNVYTSKMGGGHTTNSGTSFAAPFISAIAAMIKMVNPSYTPAQIETYLKEYCKDLGASGWDDKYGNGLPNMYNAIPDRYIYLNGKNGTSTESYKKKSGDSFTLPTPTTKSYTVTYNPNGGSVSPTSKVYNCTFDGWYENSSYTGTRHAAGSTVIVTSTKTYYAKWEDPRMTSFPTPTWSKHEFMGWYTSSSAGSGTQYTATTTITKNITLYAQWLNLQLSSTSGSMSTYADGLNGSGDPHISIWPSLNVLGWSTDLPTPSNSYKFGYTGSWELISGDGVVSGSTLYMRQPGTYKLRYHLKKGSTDYRSDIYTFTMSYGKLVSNSEANIIRSSPGGTDTGARVPAGAGYIAMSEIAYTGTLSGSGHAWGKITYNGVTGWITLCTWE